MSLPEQTRRALRARGHTLKPVVSIGSAGLSTAVLRELELSLAHHELMKVRIGGAEREQRRQMIEDICRQLDAELVQAVGHVALIYRERCE